MKGTQRKYVKISTTVEVKQIRKEMTSSSKNISSSPRKIRQFTMITKDVTTPSSTTKNKGHGYSEKQCNINDDIAKMISKNLADKNLGESNTPTTK